MPKSKKTEIEIEIDPNAPKPRLRRLSIKNFRCIGEQPVVIELNDLVVLVGPNNVGKSSILRAYELLMLDGSGLSKLDINDFPNSIVNEEKLPEIELESIVFDNTPGETWIEEIELNGRKEKVVREKWTWPAPFMPPVRVGWIVKESRWATDQDKPKMPWGAPNIANSMRPQPHRVGAFDSPEVQTKEIIKILSSILLERIKTMTSPEDGQNKHQGYSELVEKVKTIKKDLIQDSQAEIVAVENLLSSMISKIFHNYEIVFDAKPEDDVDKLVENILFKSNPQLLMGPKGLDHFKSPVDKQGSGARRTLLWTALKIQSDLSEQAQSNRSHILLLDEPEICLHPNAIRQASNLLYELPRNGNWQVMITTHSPAFIDISKDNTTIVRVDNSTGDVKGTTVFRPELVMLDEDDKTRLKLMNIYDPYVAEFFFGKSNIIVEGDTEYTAFKYIMAEDPDAYDGVHVIRARGKSTIISLIKILNHFGSPYSVLHDSDLPKTQSGNKNPAWSVNEKIKNEFQKSTPDIRKRLVSSGVNFDIAFLGQKIVDEKPYAAIEKLKSNSQVFDNVSQLLKSLIDFSQPIPEAAIEWTEMNELEEFVHKLTK